MDDYPVLCHDGSTLVMQVRTSMSKSREIKPHVDSAKSSKIFLDIKISYVCDHAEQFIIPNRQKSRRIGRGSETAHGKKTRRG